MSSAAGPSHAHADVQHIHSSITRKGDALGCPRASLCHCVMQRMPHAIHSPVYLQQLLCAVKSEGTGTAMGPSQAAPPGTSAHPYSFPSSGPGRAGASSAEGMHLLMEASCMCTAKQTLFLRSVHRQLRWQATI